MLSDTPCRKSVELLEKELREHGLLPTKYDWKGDSSPGTYEELVCIFTYYVKFNFKLFII